MVGQTESARYQGFPDNFEGARDELTIDEGLLLKRNCICIPPEVYDRPLHELHDMHLGIEKKFHTELEPHYIDLG